MKGALLVISDARGVPLLAAEPCVVAEHGKLIIRAEGKFSRAGIPCSVVLMANEEVIVEDSIIRSMRKRYPRDQPWRYDFRLDQFRLIRSVEKSLGGCE